MDRYLLDTNIFVFLATDMLTYSRLTLNEAQGHKDPSDHVIIAHALTERLTLISSDRRFAFYRGQGLDLIWNER